MATVIVICVTVIACVAMVCSVAVKAIDAVFEVKRPRSFAEWIGGKRDEEEE